MFALGAKIDASFGKSFSNAQRQIGATSKQAERANKTFGGLGSALKGVGVAALAYVGFSTLKGFITDGIEAAKENEKTMAQLGAVLKSTGGASGMTAKSIMNLTNKLNTSTTFTKASILEGENLLLTFTHIGKKAFPQATKAMLNMSIALKKDVSSSAIMLGKALNDPTKGLTALSKAGVSFTAEQKKQIAAMQKSGNVMGAQKIILAELNKEFGGSVEAQANTVSGRIAIAEKNLKSIRTKIGNALLPAVSDLLSIVLKNMPAINAGMAKVVDGANWLAKAIKTNVIPGVKELGDVIIATSPILAALTAAYVTNKAVIIATTIIQSAHSAALAISNGLIAIQCARIEYQSVVAGGGSAVLGVTTAAQWLWNAAMTANPIGLVITGVAALVVGIIVLVKNWDKVTAAIKRAWEWLTKWKGSKGSKGSGTVDTGALMQAGKNAQGTNNWRGGLSWVGEKGPELVNLSRGAQVYDHQQSMAMVQNIKQRFIPAKDAAQTLPNRKSLSEMGAALRGSANNISNGAPIFKCEITIQGNADEGVIKDAAGIVASEFRRMYRDMQRQDKRLQFSPS
jgi:hypothetical protein